MKHAKDILRLLGLSKTCRVYILRKGRTLKKPNCRIKPGDDILITNCK